MIVLEADLNRSLASSHSQYSLNFPTTRYPLSTYRLDKSVFPFRAYIETKVLDVICKTSLVHATIYPNITAIAVFLIVLISSDIYVAIIFCWFPTTLPVSRSLYKLALVARAIRPNILAFAMELAIFVLTFVLVSIYENFTSKSFLHTFDKCTVIVFLLWKL